MKKVLYFFIGFVAFIGIIFLLSTGSVKVDPLMTSTYFEKTMVRIDSIRKTENAMTDLCFSRILKSQYHTIYQQCGR